MLVSSHRSERVDRPGSRGKVRSGGRYGDWREAGTSTAAGKRDRSSFLKEHKTDRSSVRKSGAVAWLVLEAAV